MFIIKIQFLHINGCIEFHLYCIIYSPLFCLLMNNSGVHVFLLLQCCIPLCFLMYVNDSLRRIAKGQM